MKSIFYLIWILFSLLSLHSYAQQQTTLSAEELKLYNLIMEYRESKGLKKIPLSNALTIVAQTHCMDLINNKPDLPAHCNSHSWSDQGKWSPCCYTPDHKSAQCMWDKPKELTEYKGFGFEITGGDSRAEYADFIMTAEYALKSWQNSFHHNNVITNNEIWNDQNWKAIGIGVKQGFATVWFGSETDPTGSPRK